MERPDGPWRRYGPLLALLTLLVLVFVQWTLPALRERAKLAEETQTLREQRDRLSGEATERALWRKGAVSDPVTRERLEQQWERSPDVPGVIHRPAMPTNASSAGGVPEEAPDEAPNEVDDEAAPAQGDF